MLQLCIYTYSCKNTLSYIKHAPMARLIPCEYNAFRSGLRQWTTLIRGKTLTMYIAHNLPFLQSKCEDCVTKQLLAVHVLRLCTHIKLHLLPSSTSFIILHMACGGAITPHKIPPRETETEHSADEKVCVYIKVKVSICWVVRYGWLAVVAFAPSFYMISCKSVSKIAECIYVA